MQGLNPKIYQIILFSLLGISAILYLLFALSGGEIVSHGILIGWSYIMGIVAAAAAVIFAVLQMAKDFQKAKTSLIGVGVLVIIFILGYSLASDESIKAGQQVIEGSTSRFSEAGLITFYVMIVLAVVSIIYSEVSKAFK